NSPLHTADTPAQRRELERRQYALRSASLALTDSFEVGAYALLRSSSGPIAGVTTSTSGGAIPSSSGIELAWRPFSPVASHPRLRTFGRFAANAAGCPSVASTRPLSVGPRS